MKNLIMLLCVVITLAMLGGCTSQSETGNLEIIVPSLYVNLISEAVPKQHIRAIQGVTNWTVCDEDGNCAGILADSAHSLHLTRADLNRVTLFLENGINEIELQFSKPPQTISVKRWPIKHWYAVRLNHDNMTNAVNAYEFVSVSETMTIHVNDDGRHYIYEVYAAWEEGFLFYTFHTASSHTSNSQVAELENVHPFAIALLAFFDEIPAAAYTEYHFGWCVENSVVSDTTAFIIDIDGNGTMGVVAYKAIGEIDFYRIFYMFNGELRIIDFAGMWFYRLYIGESPLVITSGGEGAGSYYFIYSLTADGLVVTSELWDFLNREYHHRTQGFGLPFNDDSLVSENEFIELREYYSLNDNRWLPFIRKSHNVRNAPDTYRQDDTFAILRMRSA